MATRNRQIERKLKGVEEHRPRELGASAPPQPLAAPVAPLDLLASIDDLEDEAA